MGLAERYLAGLKQAWLEHGGSEEWNAFEAVVCGADESDLVRLKEAYPDVPDLVLNLLRLADGTYWRQYGTEKIRLYFLGSDLESFPYYLLSSAQMMADREEIDWLKPIVARKNEDLEVDARIGTDADGMSWLHFADCFNNGGSSQLYLDFTPSEFGTKGQVVRYLHDPDELVVISDSFEDYIRMLMDEEYQFLDALEDEL